MGKITKAYFQDTKVMPVNGGRYGAPSRVSLLVPKRLKEVDVSGLTVQLKSITIHLALAVDHPEDDAEPLNQLTEV